MLLVGLNDLLKIDDPENLKRDLRVSDGECVHVSLRLSSLQCCYPLIDLLLGNQFTMSPLTQSVEVIVDHDQKPLAVSGWGHEL